MSGKSHHHFAQDTKTTLFTWSQNFSCICTREAKLQEYDYRVNFQIFQGNFHFFLGKAIIAISIKFNWRMLKAPPTMTAMTNIQQEWTLNSEQKLMTGVLLWDLSAAFDCVDSDILCKKLEIYGFCETSINWFLSFLTGRLTSG